MNNKADKQIGDLISVTRGIHRGKNGILLDRSSRGWLVKLETGEEADLMFSFLKLKAKKGTFENEEPWRSILDNDVSDSELTVETESSQDNVQAGTKSKDKMTTLQLRELAKQKGISVARTKADFLRIIKEMNPDEDMKLLKGKVLFVRVSELHISRLRSRRDLQDLLTK